MKILFVIHAFPPHSWYGSENYAFGLAQHLKKDHDVFVFHRVGDKSRPEYATEEYDYEGLRVRTVNNTFKNARNFADTYRNDVIAGIFGEYVDRIKPDVVHIHHLTCLSTTIIEEAHKRGIPIIFTLHDFWLFCPRGQFLKRDLSVCDKPRSQRCVFCNAYQLGLPAERVGKAYAGAPLHLFPRENIFGRILGLYRRRRAYKALGSDKGAVLQVEEREKHIGHLCRSVRTFIAPSRFMHSLAIQAGIRKHHIVFSRYGYNRGQMDGFSRRKGSGMRFGFIGSIIPSKGAHVLVRAFRSVEKSDARLTIFGGTYSFEGYEDYFDRVKKMAEGDKRIVFAGALDNTKIGEAFAQIDVLVVPSIWYENSPLTVEEAILTRTPLLVSNIGGLKERIAEVKGLTFAPGKTGELARKMRLLAGKPGLIERLRPDPMNVRTVESEAEFIVQLYRGEAK